MNLLPYLFILIPSVIGIHFYNKLANIKESKLNIQKYFIYVLLSNIFDMTIFIYIFKFNDNLYEKMVGSLSFTLKYSIILIIINYVIGFLDFILLKYFDIEVIEKHEKRSKKNN